MPHCLKFALRWNRAIALADVQIGSIATELGYPRDVRFPPIDRTTDIWACLSRRHERLAQLEMKVAANWAALIERDPDPVLCPPRDMAEKAQSIIRHD